MGHIKLAAPVSHIWYFKGIPSRMGLVPRRDTEKPRKRYCISRHYHRHRSRATPGWAYKEILTRTISIREAKEQIRPTDFEAGHGRRSPSRKLLAADRPGRALQLILRTKLASCHRTEKIRIVRRLEVVEALRTFRQPAGIDDHGRDSGHPAGSASDGTAGRRQIRNLRPQRPVQTCHQQKQQAEQTARSWARRTSSSETKRECCRKQWTPSSITADAAEL